MKPSTKAALDRYAQDHLPTGNFLRGVLENNLLEAITRADEENLRDLPEIIKYVYNDLPSPCWGSKQAVQNWLERKEPQ